MKRVVSFFTFFLLLTLSNAFRTETTDLTQVFDHDDHQLQIKPSSDSSKILLPTESSAVPDDTKSKSSPVEGKESVEITPYSLTNRDLHLFHLMNRIPNRYSFPIFRYKYNPHGCRQLHRFLRHPRRFIGINELGAAPVLEMDLKDHAEVEATKVLNHRHEARNFPEVEGDDLRMFYQFTGPPYHRPHHRHHHHDHDEEEDDQRAEIKTEAQEEHEHEEREKEGMKHKDHDHEHGNRKKYLLKKIRKFLGYF